MSTEAMGRMLAELAAQVEELTAALAQLQAAQSGQPGQDGAGRGRESAQPRPWCWLRLSRREQAERLAELGDWVREVLFVSPAAQRAYRPCWPRHWDVIEELSMLYCAWQTAYLWEGAGAREAADYVDRLLPAAIERAAVRLRPCAEVHRPDGDRRDDEALVARAVADLERLAEVARS